MWQLPLFCPSTSWVEGQHGGSAHDFGTNFGLLPARNLKHWSIGTTWVRGPYNILLFASILTQNSQGNSQSFFSHIIRLQWKTARITESHGRKWHWHPQINSNTMFNEDFPNKPRPHPPFKLGHFEVISPFAGNPERIRKRIRDLTSWTWMDISTYPWRK